MLLPLPILCSGETSFAFALGRWRRRILETGVARQLLHAFQAFGGLVSQPGAFDGSRTRDSQICSLMLYH